MWLEVWEEVSAAMALVVAGAAIVAVFYAVIVRSATKRVAGLEVQFGEAYVTTLMCWFMMAVAQVIIGGIGAVSKTAATGNMIVMVLGPPAAIFAQACVLKWRLYVRFRLGMVISLLVAFIVTVLAVLGTIGYRVVTYSG